MRYRHGEYEVGAQLRVGWRSTHGWRGGLYIVVLVLAAVYVGWRSYDLTILAREPQRLLVALPFAAAELILIINLMRAVMLLRARTDRSSDVDRDNQWWLRSRPPLVAILIPTLNESKQVLIPTLIGATRQDYPRYSVYVLDDGDREEIRGLAQMFSVGYISRLDKQGAKAGNLNAALKYLQTMNFHPDHVAVLDADFVALPSFLRRTMALMKDKSVGLVQTPQLFVNRDPTQAAFPTTTGIPDDFRYMYDTVNPALDARGDTGCRGTSFLVRTEALESIGGFAEDSVAEDLLTTLELQRKEWKLLYLCERLSFGLATESLGELLRQRARWGAGIGQVARLEWRHSKQGLWKKIKMLESLMRWPISVLCQLILIYGAPFAYWTFRLVPYASTSTHLVIYGLPFFMISRAYFTWISTGRYLPLFREAQQVVAAAALIRGAFRGFVAPAVQQFSVTIKGITTGGTAIYWRSVMWIGFLTCGAVSGFVRLGFEGKRSFELDLAFALWSIYAVVVSTIALCLCIEFPNRRRYERLSGRGTIAEIEGVLGKQPVALVDVSCSGALLSTPEALVPIGSRVNFVFPFTKQKVSATVVRSFGKLVAIEFDADFAALGVVVSNVFSSVYLPRFEEGRFISGLVAVVRRIVGGLIVRPRCGRGARFPL